MNHFEQYNWLLERVSDFGIRVKKANFYGATYVGNKFYDDYTSASIAMIKALDAVKVEIPDEVRNRPSDAY